MELIACDNSPSYKGIVKKLLKMKLTVILVIAVSLNASATVYAQKVSLNERNVSLEKVFQEIKKQTSYTFVYRELLIKNTKKIAANFTNVSLEEALTTCLKDQGLTYSIVNRVVVIREEGLSQPKEDTYTQQPPPINITGKVSSSEGVPLVGATVSEKGTTNSVTTKNDGTYAISVASQKSILVFSFVGYDSKEIPVKNQKTVTITLNASNVNLNDVVVIGYGTVKKKDVTSAVSSVDIEEFKKAPVVSIEQALAGRVTGVTVVSQDGQPGSASEIVIRGNNSLTQDNSPLYIIDGFPVERPDNNMLNPAEMESIEILKDASATAIYGARGANGVIVITTKKGRTGPPQVEFQYFTSRQRVTQRIDLMDPYDYVKYLYELNPVNTLATYLRNVPDIPEMVDSVMNLYKNIKGLDMQDAVFGAPAPFSNYYLSMRGGNEKTKYNISGNYADQVGILVNSGFRRYQLKTNLEQSISTKLKIGINSTYTFTDQYGVQSAGSGTSGLAGGTSYLMASVWGYRPTTFSGNVDLLLENPNDTDIDPNNASQIYNPLFSTKNEYHKNFKGNLFVNTYADYQVMPKLRLRVTAGFNKTNGRAEDFYNSLTSRGRISPINTNGVNGSYNITDQNSLTNENTLTYTTTIKKNHHLNVLAGVTGQLNKSINFFQGATNIPNESLVMAGLSQGIAGVPVVSLTENTLLSGLTRVLYDYKSKYLFSATYRADASSKFVKANRWSYFPAFSAAWRFSNEGFMKKIKAVSSAKLRFGFGVTGNNRVSDYATFSSLNGGYLPVNGVFQFINSLGALGNKDLKWETTTQLNAGLDIEFLKGRIALTVDAYKKITDDLLLNAQLPTSSGYSSGFKNVGKVANTGLEFLLNTINVKNKQFEWTSTFNISFNRNKVIELAENQEFLYGFVYWNGNFNSSPLYIAKKGQPLGQMYGYVSDGVYQYSDFDLSPSGANTLKSTVTSNFTTRTTLPTPGVVKLKDLNGDGVITPADRTAIGSGFPVHTGGFTNNFRYKKFDLSIFFQWSYGNQIYNANRLVFENGSPNNSLSYMNMYKSYVNRWSPSNQTNDMPKANSGVIPGSYYWSRCVEDGSYIRLKTLSFGYSLTPEQLGMSSKRNYFKQVRFYFSTQNLFTWTNYTGFDPEVNARASALTPGFDYSVYPRANTISLGANLNF